MFPWGVFSIMMQLIHEFKSYLQLIHDFKSYLFDFKVDCFTGILTPAHVAGVQCWVQPPSEVPRDVLGFSFTLKVCVCVCKFEKDKHGTSQGVMVLV